jgi:hypothetical protein
LGLHSNPITEDSMTPIHDHNDVQPFRTDTEYLEAEFAWVTARCLHLGARLDAERDARDAEPALAFADEPEAAWPEETRAKVKRLAAAEATIRERGFAPGLDRRSRAMSSASKSVGQAMGGRPKWSGRRRGMGAR